MPATACATPIRVHEKYVQSDRLAAEITELFAHITAAEFRFLELLAEFDEKGYWELGGVHSCAHWLTWQCSIGINAAREKVRVARALRDLPKIREAFARAEISYSKVRAITRAANAENEDYLLHFARHGTACHVEKLIAGFRRVKRLQTASQEKKPHELREVTSRWDEDGCLVVTARLPAEQGALLLKALDLALDRQYTNGREASGTEDVSAETPAMAERRRRCERRADALAEMAEHYLDSEAPTGSAGDRYQVVVHVSAETLTGRESDLPPADHVPGVSAETPSTNDTDLPYLRNGTRVSAETSPARNARRPRSDNGPGVSAGTSPASDLHVPESHKGPNVSAETRAVQELDLPRLDAGPGVSAETSRRLACDCSVVPVFKGITGEPLSVGRKTRAIPPAIMRALRIRDGGCRFPGCTNTRFVDGHHIEHWADGGETSLENLVLLCRHHHRLVHEGGFGCERSHAGGVIFKSPRGNVIPQAFAMAPPPSVNEPVAWIRQHVDCEHIDSQTCVTRWTGERCDWDLAVGHLFVEPRGDGAGRSSSHGYASVLCRQGP